MAYPDNVLRLQLDRHRFVFLSARWTDRQEPQEQFNTTLVATFAYIDGGWAAEWETRYGPIQIHRRAELPDGQEPVAKQDAVRGDIISHHIFPFVFCEPLAWSQVAVDDNGLPAAMVDGDWDHIFATLQRFVEARL